MGLVRPFMLCTSLFFSYCPYRLWETIVQTKDIEYTPIVLGTVGEADAVVPDAGTRGGVHVTTATVLPLPPAVGDVRCLATIVWRLGPK